MPTPENKIKKIKKKNWIQWLYLIKKRKIQLEEEKNKNPQKKLKKIKV